MGHVSAVFARLLLLLLVSFGLTAGGVGARSCASAVEGAECGRCCQQQEMRCCSQEPAEDLASIVPTPGMHDLVLAPVRVQIGCIEGGAHLEMSAGGTGAPSRGTQPRVAVTCIRRI